MENYCLCEKTLKNEDGIRYRTYGISSANGIVIHDITPDNLKLSRFIKLINEINLSPIHLHDAIDDFLTM